MVKVVSRAPDRTSQYWTTELVARTARVRLSGRNCSGFPSGDGLTGLLSIGVDQILAVPSVLPETRVRPSGENARDHMEL